MNEKINLLDLSARLAERAEITKKEAETFLREYFEVMSEGLINDNILKIRDLGTFKLLMVENRESIDVTTGERFLIPAHYKVAFTPDKKLAETINDPFAFFETIEMDDKSSSEDLTSFSEEKSSINSEPVFENEEDRVFEEEEEQVAEEEEESAPEKEIVPDDEDMYFIDEMPDDRQEFALEDIVFQDVKDTLVIENEFIPEIKEEIVIEKSQIPEIFTSESKRQYICDNCLDARAHMEYRKKFYVTRKKLRWLSGITLLLAILLVIAAGCIALMFFGLGSLKFF